MKLLFATLVLLILTASSQAQIFDAQLIGGKVAEPGQFPSIVKIQMGLGQCTASVIGPRTLLTAAHCTEAVKSVRAYFGTVWYRATCTVHPKFPSDFSFDFSVCRSYVDLPVSVADIYPVADSVPAYRAKVIQTGYGCKESGGTGYDDHLRYGTATVQLWGWKRYFKTSEGTALCYGDSGGPVLYQGKQVGVNSRGNIKDTSWIAPTAVAYQWIVGQIN